MFYPNVQKGTLFGTLALTGSVVIYGYVLCSEPYSVQQLTTTASNTQIHSGGRPAEEEIQAEAASREESAEEPALCSTSAVLENVPQDMSKDFVEMLVENICKNFQSQMKTQHEFSLEILSDLCSAVVTFSSGKGCHLFFVILKIHYQNINYYD